MKSLSSEVNESDERLLRYALPNTAHCGPRRRPRGRRDRPAPRRTSGPTMAPSPSDSFPGIGTLLIEPVATPSRRQVDLRVQHGSALFASHWAGAPVVTQRDSHRVGLVPPRDRSYWISASPSLRTGVTPLDDSCAGLVELEVHVRRAVRLLDATPEQVEEAAGRGVLRGRRRVGQVALLRRDAAVHDRSGRACPPSCPARTSRRPRRTVGRPAGAR